MRPSVPSTSCCRQTRRPTSAWRTFARRLEVAETRCSHAANVLEELQAAGNLARVHVSQVVTEPITSEEELDVALGRIRHAALAELAEGKQVRLQ